MIDAEGYWRPLLVAVGDIVEDDGCFGMKTGNDL